MEKQAGITTSTNIVVFAIGRGFPKIPTSVTSGLNIFLRKAGLQINSNKTFNYTNFFTTKVDYVKNDKGRPICKDDCKDACAGDSGEVNIVLFCKAEIHSQEWIGLEKYGRTEFTPAQSLGTLDRIHFQLFMFLRWDPPPPS